MNSLKVKNPLLVRYGPCAGVTGALEDIGKAPVQVLAEGKGEQLKHDGINVLAVAPWPVAIGLASQAKLTGGMTAVKK